MNDIWKLPKATRKFVIEELQQIEDRIKARKDDARRFEMQMNGAKFDVERLERDLTRMKKKFNIPE